MAQEESDKIGVREKLLQIINFQTFPELSCKKSNSFSQFESCCFYF